MTEPREMSSREGLLLYVALGYGLTSTLLVPIAIAASGLLFALWGERRGSLSPAGET
jgi:hypothetical protein